MKTAWYGSEKARVRYCPDAEKISEQSQLTSNRCVVWLDPSDGQIFDWFERQLRLESTPKAWLLLSITPLSELCTQSSWLTLFHNHFLSLPLEQPEQLSQKLEQLQPLPESDLLKLRQILFEESFERLCHDAAKQLLDWPKHQKKLEFRLKQFSTEIPFGYASKLKNVQQLLTQLKQQSSDSIWKQIQHFSQEPTQTRQTHDLDLATKRQKLKSIIRHWQALPEKLKRLQKGLESIDLNQQALTLKIPFTNINAVEIQILANQLQTLTESEHYSNSELSRLCHNTIEQHVFHILDELQTLGLDHNHLSLETVEKHLEQLGPEPAAEIIQPAAVNEPKQGPLHIIVVENETSWQASILDILNLVCHNHGWTDQQVIFGPKFSATNSKEAQELIKQYRKQPMLVITDLSIPETDQTEPHPEVGEKLLRHMLSVGQNLPLLLLTTPQHALTEQRRLTQLGFNQVDFVLKLSLDKLYERLEEWLTQQIESRFFHTIEMDYRLKTVKIDNINIELGKVSFALLWALAEKYQEGTRFFDQSDLMGNSDLKTALSEQNDPAGFSKSFYQLKKELLKGMSESERFLMLSEIIEDKQDSNKKTFRIRPKKNQVTLRNNNENYYNDIENSYDDELSDADSIDANNRLQPKLLIVEDEVEWAKEIADLALEMGFICQRVSTIEDAKLALESFKPDLLTLDLQLPQREGEIAHESGGFEVLLWARELNPAIRIVIPSTHFRRGALVSQAAKLKVPLMDFVPKGASVQGVSWLIYLYNRLRAHRLELQQLQDQADTYTLLPPLNLSVIEAQDKIMLEVNGELWSATSLEAKLLQTLVPKAGQWVIYDDLYNAIYPETELSSYDRHEEFEQVLKRARRVMTRQWLKGQVKDKMGLHLLERQGQRFCLHANSL